jgi:mannosyltransferase OCH1-like enzyme
MCLIIIILIIIILFYLINKILYKKELFSDEKIPLILYKTGPFDTIPENINKLFKINKKNLNLKEIIYFNDNDCNSFMKDFGEKYYKAYNMLIPNAFKADLWRYCVLYKNGGIYGDLTQYFLIKYNVNKENVDMVLVKDGLREDIQISFMATIKNNNFYKYLIDNITNNILNKNKGENVFDITGPRACAKYFFKFFSINSIPLGINTLKGLDNNFYKIRIDMQQAPRSFINIYNNKKVVITKIKQHDKLITKNGKQEKYHGLYQNNNIFRDYS